MNEKQHHQAERNEYNFDHPDAFDIDLMVDVLRKLKEGRKVDVPVYNFVTHSREQTTVSLIRMIKLQLNLFCFYSISLFLSFSLSLCMFISL